jgi:hypothetical protein
MRRLTTKWIGCLRKTGMDEVEHGVANSGEPERKGTVKFDRLSTPFLDSFYQNDPETHALLVDYLRVHGVASSDGGVMISSDRAWQVAGNREGLRENGVASRNKEFTEVFLVYL